VKLPPDDHVAPAVPGVVPEKCPDTTSTSKTEYEGEEVLQVLVESVVNRTLSEAAKYGIFMVTVLAVLTSTPVDGVKAVSLLAAITRNSVVVLLT